MGRAVTVKSELAVNMAAVCLGGSMVPATVIIVVEYRLVYQLVNRLSAYQYNYYLSVGVLVQQLSYL